MKENDTRFFIMRAQGAKLIRSGLGARDPHFQTSTLNGLIVNPWP